MITKLEEDINKIIKNRDVSPVAQIVASVYFTLTGIIASSPTSKDRVEASLFIANFLQTTAQAFQRSAELEPAFKDVVNVN